MTENTTSTPIAALVIGEYGVKKIVVIIKVLDEKFCEVMIGTKATKVHRKYLSPINDEAKSLLA